MNIEVQIGELVLYGFAPGKYYRIDKAVERELTRLFMERLVPPSLATNADVAHLNGGTFQMVSGSKPETIGAQVAQAVYEGLNR